MQIIWAPESMDIFFRNFTSDSSEFIVGPHFLVENDNSSLNFSE